MSSAVLGMLEWGLGRNKEGHREYTAKWLVESTDPDDGPQTILNTPGLPAIGSPWAFGNDSDASALCWPDWKFQMMTPGEPCVLWICEQKFTTEPLSRCQDTQIENPLDEPPRLSGSFVKYTKEARFDKDGNAVKNSSFELFRGKQVERDYNRPTVNIEFNSLSLSLGLFSYAMDTVNDATLWDLEARSIKLSAVSWQRQLYGTCSYYYTIGYEFDVDFEKFTRKIVDEGNKVIRGQWIEGVWTADGGIDKANPQNYIQFKDVNDENTRVFLKDGEPLSDLDDPVELTFDFYTESNLLALGIPSSLT